MTLFALTPMPRVPHTHPLHEYAQYMLDMTARLHTLMIWHLVIGLSLVAMGVVVLVFIIRFTRIIAVQIATCRDLLAAVKGRATLADAREANTLYAVKAEVAAVPEATAVAVVEKLEAKSASDSNVIRRSPA